VSSAEEFSLEAELPVSQPEAACARPVLPPVAELPDAARVSALDGQLRAARVPAYSAVPRAGVRCARAAQRVWFQDGSAPVVVSPALELAGLPQDALALSPDDSALAVPQADARYAQAVQQALPVQRDGSVALPPDDSAAPPE
jgi:hypothetical protein